MTHFTTKFVNCRNKLEMWANAQHDGHLPNIGGALCSMLQFAWRPLPECHAVMLPRCETRWNLQGCPKLANRSCRPKFTTLSGHVEEVLVFNKYFSDCRYMPYFCRYSPTKLCDCAKMATFLRPVFPASRVQHIPHLHSKFALGPHHVWNYGRHPICGRWD